MIFLTNLAGYLAAYSWMVVFTLAAITAIELLVPRESQSLSGRLVGLMFWALWVPVTATMFGGFHRLWTEAGVEPLIVLPLRMEWAGVLAGVAAPLAAAAVADFFFYWCHRAQHRWFWRFHAVHHSIRELNAVNSYHHVTEPVFQTVMILLPMSLIVSDAGIAAPAMVVALKLHASFIHSPSRWHFGPLRGLFVDNRFHRIHHSVEPRHFDRNFGAFTTLWDRLFGTAHFPGRNEWPAVGIAGVDQPRTLREWLAMPSDRRADSDPTQDLNAAPTSA
ncbi:fatty acid hydroxylase family protein [Sphingomonas gilva]|uniref:Fatty acid hydroxylase family protein n=1 Tax=Sphingomonas gilva TaxID=2305907 RepID=A0A396RVC0_9SPHN|nr:sterol desaturase family protein [Sphingomonas gilva]RHW19352.1 fatty acid hydroxylase family protein [Sphingomonas gilva]